MSDLDEVNDYKSFIGGGDDGIFTKLPWVR